jgi:hypothetical protein
MRPAIGDGDNAAPTGRQVPISIILVFSSARNESGPLEWFKVSLRARFRPMFFIHDSPSPNPATRGKFLPGYLLGFYLRSKFPPPSQAIHY